MVKLRWLKEWEGIKVGEITQSGKKSAENFVSQGYAEYFEPEVNVNENTATPTLPATRCYIKKDKVPDFKSAKEEALNLVGKDWDEVAAGIYAISSKYNVPKGKLESLIKQKERWDREQKARTITQKDNQKVEKPLMPPEEVKEKINLIYEDIIRLLKKYLDLQEEHYSLIALWVIGTYCHSNFNTYPYLFLNAMRGSGKTRLLKLLAALCKNGKIQANISEAVLFRNVKGSTIIIDEFEDIGSKEKNTLRELLNAGYKKGIYVERMKKVNTEDGEGYEVERFDLFTPIVMANIWGMEEVLSDRCLTLIIEKSNKKGITKLIEDFERNPKILDLKVRLNDVECSYCSLVQLRGVDQGWNKYVEERYCDPNSTLLLDSRTTNYITTHTTQTTPNNITTPPEIEQIYNKIDSTGIEGRNLELFFPLFTIAYSLGEECLDNILNIAKEMTYERKNEEFTESRDVLLINFLAYNSELWGNDLIPISKVTSKFKEYVGNSEDEIEWLNTKWLGRAMKRLKLFKRKTRLRKGVLITIDHDNARRKAMLFASNSEWDGTERRKESVPVQVDRRKAA